VLHPIVSSDLATTGLAFDAISIKSSMSVRSEAQLWPFLGQPIP